jgi:subtilisin-like proprotein convertase family protein
MSMATSDFDIATIIEQTPLFSKQWYLQNTGQTGGTPGADANIVNAWSTATGTGVVIGIVDEGVQYTHADLNDNYNSALSYDFRFDDSEPLPLESENHGTQVAGIAVAEGDNDTGIIGAAPDATFASLQIDFDYILEDYLALSYLNQDIDIYSNSWNLSENFTEIPQLTQDAIESSIKEGRGGLGNIYVFAAGNNALEEDNVNYDRYTNSRYTITVAAIDHNGEHSDYSNLGASLLVSGYTSNDDVKVTTTDNGTDIYPDGYAEDFGGTSAATPLVSGVIALMLEANPNLTWRDVQHIIVETAEKNDPSDLDWLQNGAGHDVNYKYGFGAIDATAAVNRALSWENVAEEVSLTSEPIEVNTPIPDNDVEGISSNFNLEEDIDVEWIEVVFDAEHTWRGDLEIVLTSPDGTESILAESRSDNEVDYDNWVFTSSRHWGESSQGEWTLTVSDNINLSTGAWNSWQINLYGTEKNNITPESEPEDLLETDIFRFQNEAIPGTYVYVGNEEAENIRENFDNFTEEGLAFQVAVEPNDELMPMYRFQSIANPGTYLLAGEQERESINNNFADSFTEEGLAFYVYGADSNLGETVYRFRNLEQPGTYLFATENERDNIIANYSNFIEEGAAFKVDI